jgi:hypothetical protein
MCATCGCRKKNDKHKDKKVVKVKGQKHIVDKHGKKVEVHHPGKKGKTYVLPAKTTKEGAKQVKEWHKNNG